MRYETIEKCECLNGSDVGVSLWVCGCPIRCKGCHNENLWDANGGKPFTLVTQSKIRALIEPEYIKRFSILGGEPLVPDNYFIIASMLQSIKYAKPTITIWLYTGYTYESLKKQAYESIYLDSILNTIDYLVDGPFIQEERDTTLAFRGSRNQRILRNLGNGVYKDFTKKFDKGTD